MSELFSSLTQSFSSASTLWSSYLSFQGEASENSTFLHKISFFKEESSKVSRGRSECSSFSRREGLAEEEARMEALVYEATSEVMRTFSGGNLHRFCLYSWLNRVKRLQGGGQDTPPPSVWLGIDELKYLEGGVVKSIKKSFPFATKLIRECEVQLKMARHHLKQLFLKYESLLNKDGGYGQSAHMGILPSSSEVGESGVGSSFSEWFSQGSEADTLVSEQWEGVDHIAQLFEIWLHRADTPRTAVEPSPAVLPLLLGVEGGAPCDLFVLHAQGFLGRESSNQAPRNLEKDEKWKEFEDFHPHSYDVKAESSGKEDRVYSGISSLHKGGNVELSTSLVSPLYLEWVGEFLSDHSFPESWIFEHLKEVNFLLRPSWEMAVDLWREGTELSLSPCGERGEDLSLNLEGERDERGRKSREGAGQVPGEMEGGREVVRGSLSEFS